MGFFSEIVSEARRNGGNAAQSRPAALSREATPGPVPAASSPFPNPAPAPKRPPEPTAAPTEPAPAPAPAKPEEKPEARPTPVIPTSTPPAGIQTPELKLDAVPDAATATDDDARRKAHEAAEAKRKAEFDARQAGKKAARQAQLDKIANMSAAELLAESVKRVADDTERLTRRNMKEAVAEHIQARCREDIPFAMLVMDPMKSMIRCFRYINRKAREYAEREMKDNGVERTGVYGLDIPDGLCFQWAEDYFNDLDAEEDHKDDEKFVSKPYAPPSAGRKTAKSKTKKPASKETPKTGKPKPDGGMEQISLM